MSTTRQIESGILRLDEIAAPDTPPSGKVSIYAKSDHKAYRKDSTGTETELGGGAGGGAGDTLTQTLDTSVAAGVLAGEAITDRDAVCLEVHNGTGANVYRIFKCDADLSARRSFAGFATAAATVTANIKTYTISAEYVASNVVPIVVNGRTYSTTYATSSDATLQALATATATDQDVASAEVTVVGGNQTGTDDRVITITGKGGISLNITGTDITGGASQPTVTIDEAQAPAADAVVIQQFGPLDGFTSLTVGAAYYLSGTAGAITTSPSDTCPVYVGRAMAAAVLFVDPKGLFTTSWGSPEVFIRSHGSSNNSYGAPTQDSEHFNFTAWAAGVAASAGAALCGANGGSTAYNGSHHWLDGMNSSPTITAQFCSYNKTSWSTLTNRTPHYGFAAYSYNGFLYACKGFNGSDSATIANKWNTAAWSTGTALNNKANGSAAFSVNSLLDIMAGSCSPDTNVHETINSSGTVSSATAAPTSGFTGGSANSSGGKGIYQTSNSTNSYEWNASSWSSAITAAYTTTINGYNCSSAYSSVRALTIMNGGNAAGGALNNLQTYNSISWAAGTASSNSRTSPAGSVV